MTFDPYSSRAGVPGAPPPPPGPVAPTPEWGMAPQVRVRRRQKMSALTLLSVALGLSLVVNLVAFVVIADLRNSPTSVSDVQVEGPATPSPNSETLSPLSPAEREGPAELERLTTSDVYAQTIGSVVTVFCGQWSGTGFAFEITPPSGSQTIIVTNHHVVEDCLRPGNTVDLLELNGNYSEGHVWSHHEQRDLALIATTLRLEPLSASDGAAIGDQVVAIGSPGGLEGTLTQGIISAIRDGVYQTDAAINFGNSGGPLLDLYGRVVAVNTAIDADSVGIGFAVGIDLLCERLMSC